MNPVPVPKIVGRANRRGKAFETYLWVVILFKVASIIILLVQSSELAPYSPLATLIPMLILLIIADLAVVGALFFWQKWAIWVHVGLLVLTGVLLLLMGQIGSTVNYLFSIALFFYFLNLDDNNDRAWPQFR